jgi:O-antigen/teichoic acid export membrane protein
LTEIGRRIAAGAAWMVLFKLSERALSLVSMLVLARLLAPADFGLVAIASSVLALLEVLTTLGLDVALISKRDVQRQHYDSAWTLNVIVSAAVACALLALSLPAAAFFDEPRLTPVICVLALGAFVQGLENVGIVEFRKELQFAREFRFQIAKRLIMIAITLPLAFWWRDYWALVAGAVSGRFAWVIISYIAHPFRPRPSLAAARDLLGFSGWLLLNNLLYYFKEQTANLTLGRIAGPRSVGLYTLSYDFASLPTAQLIAPINRAVLPGLAKLSDRRDELARNALNVVALTACLAIPAGAGLAAVAPLMVPLILGAQWSDAVPVLQILALVSASAALLSSSYAAFLALQKPRIPALVDLIYVLLQLGLMIALSSRYGARGAALAALITVLTIIPLNYGLLLPRLGQSIRTLPAVVIRPALAAALMWAIVHPYAASAATAKGVVAVAQLIGMIVAGGCIYVAALFLLWVLFRRPEGAELMALRQIESRLPGALRPVIHKLVARNG